MAIGVAAVVGGMTACELRGLAQEAKDPEAFRILPQRVETTHYVVVGTAPPAILRRLGRDMDIMYEEYDREFRGLLAEPPVAGETVDRKRKMSRKARRRAARKARKQQAAKPTSSAPVHTGPKHRLVIFATRRDFNTWANKYTPTVEPWANAFFAPGLKALVAHLDRGLESVYPSLFHEGFHQFVHHYVPATPIWLNEGLAEHYEQATPTRNGWRFPPQRGRFEQCVELLDARRITPLDRLLWMDHNRFYGGAKPHQTAGAPANQHYSEAYTLVYMMLHNAETKKLLQDYVRDLAKSQGADVGAVTAKHFPPAVLARLQQGWLQTLRRY